MQGLDIGSRRHERRDMYDAQTADWQAKAIRKEFAFCRGIWRGRRCAARLFRLPRLVLSQ